MTISAPVPPIQIVDQEPRLVVNPAIAIVRCSENELFLRSGSRSSTTHRIEDTKNRGTLAGFAVAFREASTVTEAAERVGIPLEDATEFAQHLLDGKALIGEESARFGYLIAGLGVEKMPVDVDIAILGTGRLADAIAGQMADFLGREPERSDDIVGAFEANSFVIVAADTMQPGLFYDADEASAETGTPWQLVYVDGGEIMVGPTFIPGLTADYYAVDTMDEAGRTMRMEYQFFKSAVPEVPATAVVPRMIAELAASYASVAVLQHVTGAGSYLENHVLRIDLERMHVIRDRVMRLARTPRDLGSRDDLRHPFL
jgi:hypothetical protein